MPLIAKNFGQTLIYLRSSFMSSQKSIFNPNSKNDDWTNHIHEGEESTDFCIV